MSFSCKKTPDAKNNIIKIIMVALIALSEKVSSLIKMYTPPLKILKLYSVLSLYIHQQPESQVYDFQCHPSNEYIKYFLSEKNNSC